MLELTKTPRTDGTVEISIVVPSGDEARLEALLNDEFGQRYSTHEVLPDKTPGKVLAGARGLRDMTQKALADAVGVRPQYVSDMEHDRRPITPEMARKLGEALDFPYKAFL
jgi:DNA-binding XRE family transcriptional regulator